ncbi:hypothetical protein QE152_g13219 [Popillia japonica]|uniref:Uncharacterized protein n=1 Tax=Popillia japonica TaxID=7064 RepID=A0AAW1LE74_POPJA
METLKKSSSQRQIRSLFPPLSGVSRRSKLENPSAPRTGWDSGNYAMRDDEREGGDFTRSVLSTPTARSSILPRPTQYA